MTLDEFFLGYEGSRPLFDAVRAMIDSIGLTEMRISKSQIAFKRQRAIAYLWIPPRYLKGDLPPIVLTLGFDHRIESERWKEIVEPAPGHFTHHLEVWSAGDLDEQIRDWLQQAWMNAA